MTSDNPKPQNYLATLFPPPSPIETEERSLDKYRAYAIGPQGGWVSKRGNLQVAARVSTPHFTETLELILSDVDGVPHLEINFRGPQDNRLVLLYKGPLRGFPEMFRSFVPAEEGRD